MKFYPLRVTHIRKDIREVVVVTLKPDDADQEHFAYRPGQYLTFKKTFEGEELRRSYSFVPAPMTINFGLASNELMVGGSPNGPMKSSSSETCLRPCRPKVNF